MRSNGNDSKRGRRNDARSGTSATSTDSGHGSALSRGAGSSNESTEKTKDWFKPVGSDSSECADVIEEFSDCPGGVCPVPWATDTSGDDVIIDEVNRPLHYNADGGIECIEAIEAQLTPEEYRGYLKGNVTKYIWREKYKGGKQSLEKAQWYLTRLVGIE